MDAACAVAEASCESVGFTEFVNRSVLMVSHCIRGFLPGPYCVSARRHFCGESFVRRIITVYIIAQFTNLSIDIFGCFRFG